MADTLTITLTGRPPVRITKGDWPVLASVQGDSYSGTDSRQRAGHGRLVVYLLRESVDLTYDQLVMLGDAQRCVAWTQTDDVTPPTP